MPRFDPRDWLSLTELPRAGLEMSTLLTSAPFLSTAPAGDNHPVMVLPGFLASDDSTWVLRAFLDNRGYKTYPWSHGRNLGMARMGGYESLVQKVLDLYREHDQQVSLVGWSLGGVHALAVAHRAGYALRNVITLGSPIQQTSSEDMNGLYKRLREVGLRLNSLPDTGPIRPTQGWRNLMLRLRKDLPITSIYSRTDGVVSWQRSHIDPGPVHENIRVISSHLGLGVNPAVLYAVADRLAQPPGEFAPFQRSGWRSLLFPPE